VELTNHKLAQQAHVVQDIIEVLHVVQLQIVRVLRVKPVVLLNVLVLTVLEQHVISVQVVIPVPQLEQVLAQHVLALLENTVVEDHHPVLVVLQEIFV
jgi:hypothetical protein